MRKAPRQRVTRSSVRYTTPSLADGAVDTTRIRMGAYGVRLLRVRADRACRVRIYTSPAKRDADLSRAIGTDPTGDHGLLLEVVLTEAILSLDLSPEVMASNLEAALNESFPALITNTSGVTSPVAVTIEKQEVE